MNHTIRMELTQRHTHLVPNRGHILHLQWYSFGKDTFVQVSTFNILHDQINLTIDDILKVINQLNNVLVFDSVKNLNLFLNHEDFAFSFVLEVYAFDGVR